MECTLFIYLLRKSFQQLSGSKNKRYPQSCHLSCRSLEAVVCWRWLDSQEQRVPTAGINSQLKAQGHHPGRLKLAMVRVFTLHKLANKKSGLFIFFRDLVVKHLSMWYCLRSPFNNKNVGWSPSIVLEKGCNCSLSSVELSEGSPTTVRPEDCGDT